MNIQVVLRLWDRCVVLEGFSQSTLGADLMFAVMGLIGPLLNENVHPFLVISQTSQTLQNHRTLGEAGVTEGCFLDVVFNLTGGMRCFRSCFNPSNDTNSDQEDVPHPATIPGSALLPSSELVCCSSAGGISHPSSGTSPPLLASVRPFASDGGLNPSPGSAPLLLDCDLGCLDLGDLGCPDLGRLVAAGGVSPSSSGSSSPDQGLSRGVLIGLQGVESALSEGSLHVDKFSMRLGGLLITTIPLALCQFIDLLGITSLTLFSLRGLATLDMAMFLRLTDLTALSITGCPDLQSVVLTNRSGSRPAASSKLAMLTTLEFSKNQALARLPLSEIMTIKSLTALDCSKCPNLWSPPQEVAKQGGEATAVFVKEVYMTGEANLLMTLFFIGDGEVGKTSVFRALKSARNRTERIREDQRTVGIEKETWEAASACGGPAIQFSVYDLGGQAVYGTTHQFLLQQRAIYLLIWRAFPVSDDRGGPFLRSVRHWMESLQMRVPGARMMLVVTHIDAVHVTTLDTLCDLVHKAVQDVLAELETTAQKGRVLTVLDGGVSLRVNCLLGDGVAELRERVIQFAQTAPWYGETLPRSIMAVRAAVLKLKEKYISLGQWRALAATHEMKGTILTVGTRFLHETGVISFFGDFKRLTKDYVMPAASCAMAATLETTVYLSTKFLVSAMKALIRHDRQALQDYFVEHGPQFMLRRINRLNATGMLHKDVVPFLWPTSEEGQAFWKWVRAERIREAALWPEEVVSSSEDVEQATQLMIGFDLMAWQESDEEYLVPGALPPAKRLSCAGSFADQYFRLETTLTYSALPPGFFQRLVVRLASRASWCEFGSDSAVFYWMGHIAALACSAEPANGNQTKRTLLNWRSSGEKAHALVLGAVEHMERFFPGLRRVGEPHIVKQASFKELAHVLILCSIKEIAGLIANAVNSVAPNFADWRGPSLVVEEEVPLYSATPVDAFRLRVVLVCLSADFLNSDVLCQLAETYTKSVGVRVVPVLLSGCVSDFKTRLPRLSEYSPVDMRKFSTPRAFIKAEIEAQRRSLLEQEFSSKFKSAGQLKRAVESQMLKEELSMEEQVESRMREQVDEATFAIKIELMPRVISILREWKARPEGARLGAPIGSNAGGKGQLVCGRGNPACDYNFDRQECMNSYAKLQPQGMVVSTATFVIKCPRPGCAAEHDLRRLLETPEYRECPLCKASGTTPPGLFEARECRLRMGELLRQRSYRTTCGACFAAVDLLDVFPPEVYLLCHSTSLNDELTEALVREVEAEADVLVWSAPSDVARSRRAERLSCVVLALVSEAYALSHKCAAQLLKAEQAGKNIIVVLLPDLNIGAVQLPGDNADPADLEHFWKAIAKHRQGLGRADTMEWERVMGKKMPVVVKSLGDRDVAVVMGHVASRVAPLLHRTVKKLDVFSDLSRHGVRLSYLKVFVEKCGGRAALKGKTTLQVMHEFVKPQTEASQLSWCEQLLVQGDSGRYVATATVFLSHAWLYFFLDVVDAVDQHFEGTARVEPVLWFDVLSVSQHKSGVRTFDWWQSTFLLAVGSMGELLMVMLPWDAPVTLTRVWCIFETYSCETTHSLFAVAMTRAEIDRLVSTVCADPLALFRVLSGVACEACEATEPQDRVQIFEAVRRSVGFAHLDSLVCRKIVQAVCDVLRRRLDTELEAKKKADLALALGSLQALSRNDADAEGAFGLCIHLDEDNLRAHARKGLAAVCSRQNKRQEAIEHYSWCAGLLKATGGPQTLALEVEAGLAVELHAAGQHSEAKAVADGCLPSCQASGCAPALLSLARLQLLQGSPEEAVLLTNKCLEAWKRALGRVTPGSNDLLQRAREEGLWHPDALDALAIKEEALELLGRGDEALLRDLLALRERYLGMDHPVSCKTRALVRSSGVIAVGAGVGHNMMHPPSITELGQIQASGPEGGAEDEVLNDLSFVALRLHRDFSGLVELRIKQVADWVDRAGFYSLVAGMQLLRSLDLRCRYPPRPRMPLC